MPAKAFLILSSLFLTSFALAAIPTPNVQLQGLDKVTGRVFTLKAGTDMSFTFGTLKIKVHGCYKNTPEERPESSAFLEIWDQKPGENSMQVFYGWMFSSTPALSALDHPIYDVWVKECIE